MMKKFMLIIAAALLAGACEGPPGPMGPAGRDGRDGRDGEETWVWSKYYDVYANHWEVRYRGPDDLNKFYIVTLEIEELTKNVAEYGSVMVYYCFEDEDIQTPLPRVFHRELIENGEHFYFTETTSFEFEPGYIDLILTESDFPNLPYPFYNMVFRVVLTI